MRKKLAVKTAGMVYWWRRWDTRGDIHEDIDFKGADRESDFWLISILCFYWLANRGTWSKYVVNRVKMIQESGHFTWHYVSTDQNPSDLGTSCIATPKGNPIHFRSDSNGVRQLEKPQNFTLTTQNSSGNPLTASNMVYWWSPACNRKFHQRFFRAV